MLASRTLSVETCILSLQAPVRKPHHKPYLGPMPQCNSSAWRQAHTSCHAYKTCPQRGLATAPACAFQIPRLCTGGSPRHVPYLVCTIAHPRTATCEMHPVFSCPATQVADWWMDRLQRAATQTPARHKPYPEHSVGAAQSLMSRLVHVQAADGAQARPHPRQRQHHA